MDDSNCRISFRGFEPHRDGLPFAQVFQSEAQFHRKFDWFVDTGHLTVSGGSVCDTVCLAEDRPDPHSHSSLETTIERRRN